MVGFLNGCVFRAASSGTGSFVVASAIAGFLTPAQADAVNAETYRYRAESDNGTEWEIGYGAYTVSSVTLARPTIVESSNAGAAVNFTAAPIVRAGLILAQDLGVLALLTSGTVANSAATLDIVLTSYTAYSTLLLVISNFRPATDLAELNLRFSTDGGTSYDAGASDYTFTLVGNSHISPPTTSTIGDESAAFITIVQNTGNVAPEAVSGQLFLYDRLTAAARTKASFSGVNIDGSGTAFNITSSGTRVTAQDTDAIRLLWSSGNFAAATPGTYALYGVT